MSQRHRDDLPVNKTVPVPVKEELRAHAHGERHRIHVELSNLASQVSAGADPADVHEPGAAWKPEHRHDPEIARSKLTNRAGERRHWKLKMWKRRTTLRRERAAALRPIADAG